MTATPWAPLLCTTLDERTASLARAAQDPRDASHDPQQLHAWERRFTAWLGGREGEWSACGFSSGRAALLAVVRALGLGAGCDVIVPGFTCKSVTNALRFSGAGVVFADIETDTFGLDARSVREAITPSTRALLVQHSFGLPSRDLGPLLELARERGLLVIEDCAHALGARWGGRIVGTLGDGAIFSFERGKVLTTVHGGMAVVRGASAARRLDDLARAASWGSDDDRLTLLRSVELAYSQWAAVLAGSRPDAAQPAPSAPAWPALTPRMWPAEFEGRWCEAYGQRMWPAVAALAQAQFDTLDEVLRQRCAQAMRWQRWADAHRLRTARPAQGSAPAWLRFPVWADAATKANSGRLEQSLGVEIGLWFTTPEHPVPSPQPQCPQGMRACAAVVNLPTLLPPTHPHAQDPPGPGTGGFPWGEDACPA